MPKKTKELSDIEVRRLSKKGRFSVGGVPGLLLQISDSGSKSWLLRVTVGDKRRHIGIGGYPAVTLARARKKAREHLDMIEQGIDPVEKKNAEKQALRLSQAKQLTFSQAAYRCHEKKSAEFKNAKHTAQWINTLVTYAFPAIGDIPISEIKTAHVFKVLEPIWPEITETASRVRLRIENVFEWCRAGGLFNADNPAAWKGNLAELLPRPAKVKKLKSGESHHLAMPYSELPKFMDHLQESRAISSRALEFLILTGTRSGEVRGAAWDEISLKDKMWIIPGDRMKAGKEHRIPLSDAASDLLSSLPRFVGCPYVFPSPQKQRPLTDSGIAKPLKMYNPNYTVHGMRSVFRDWIAEKTDFQNIVAEQALAHSIGDSTEAAYRRGDLFEKRIELMDVWADYCGSYEPAQVIAIPK